MLVSLASTSRLVVLTPIVLRNPIYVMFLIVLAVGAYVTYSLNLWGPMLSMANAASAQAVEIIVKRVARIPRAQ